MKRQPTTEQAKVLDSLSDNLIVSASAGSGKTWVVIEFITRLVTRFNVPIKKILVLTFTRAAASEMRQRLNKALLEENATEILQQQIDDLSISDICTIDAFCEKLVRRNLDQLSLDEGFSIVEDASEQKRSAFEKALGKFEKTSPDMVQELYYSFRKNKDVIFEALVDLDDMFSAMKDSEEKLEYFLSHQSEIFDKATRLLNQNLILKHADLLRECEKTEKQVETIEVYDAFCKQIKNLFDLSLSDDFFENVRLMQKLSLPKLPIVRGESRSEELSDIVKALKKRCENFLEDLNKFSCDKDIIEKQREGSLPISLLSLYKSYKNEYGSLKASLDKLDFADIEALALKLLGYPDILDALQEKYDYIFIDEYQDTNKVQEAIVKPITAGGHFVAVGDPKQGIYGFRNATMEIMQEDIATFSAEKNSEVVYLRGNFRSDDRVLSFVNRIFEKVMTEKSVGIDYKETSMLSGQIAFDKMSLPSVRVDVVDEEKEEKEAQEPRVYDVKEAPLFVSEKNRLEIATIVARVDEVLMEKIYDEKIKAFRSVRPGDIAILFRSRGSLMGELAKELTSRGYNVTSDEKTLEIEEPEVQMLVSLLKLLVNLDDDLSLVSVMKSKLGGFSYDDLATLRLKHPDAESFYEILTLEQDSPQIKAFLKMIDSLKFNVAVKGIVRALNELFIEKNYYAYLKRQGTEKLMAVQAFLDDIKLGDLEFNLPAAISFFTAVGGRKHNSSPSGGDTIKLMTIHASKGLEFPIVFVVGAGQTLQKPSMKSYSLNREFGIGISSVDAETNLRYISPVQEIIKLENHRKDMIDEIMIFYVALTRAKNHLYIVGQEKSESLRLSENFNVLDAKNYLQLIGFAFGTTLIEGLESREHFELGDWEFNKVTEVAEPQKTNADFKISQVDGEIVRRLEEYFDFCYEGGRLCKVNLKNTVTGINNEGYERADKILLPSETGQDFVNLGNAYHKALQILDIEKIEDADSLSRELELNASLISEEYLALIDRDILLKNILLLKPILKDKKIFKEKQFIMSVSLRDIVSEDSDEEVIVQGAIDLFALGEENVLIDFKFTHETDPQKILKKYHKQLDLYSRAIESGFNIKLNKIYILSLKNAKLIEYFN